MHETPREMCTCLRCGYVWFPRKGKRTKYCARCKSGLWNKPKQFQTGPRPRKPWRPVTNTSALEAMPEFDSSLWDASSPQTIGLRVLRLKSRLKRSWREMAQQFFVTPVTVQRWAAGKCAPLLRHQRQLARLEREHAPSPQHLREYSRVWEEIQGLPR